MSKVVHRKKRLSSFKLIVLGFAAVIFVGALLLMLPVSSVSGTQTPFHEALFTSVSAVLCHRACCTGHRQLLVFFWSGSYFAADPDRRAGCHHRCCFLCHFIRTENFAHAAQYNAGCNFCTENRRYCPPDQIQRTGYIIY